MLEKDIEARVCQYARTFGVLTRKFTSPSHRSVPDRLFLFPGGLTVFIEFKQKGKKLTKPQHNECRKLIDLGHKVYLVDNVDGGKQLVDKIMEVVQTNFRKIPA